MDEIDQLFADFTDALRRGDCERIAELVSEDAEFWSPGTPAMKGRDHVRTAMRAACEQSFLGGFSLANYLTLRHAIPHRQAQVIAGSYIVAAMARQHAPRDLDLDLLAEVCAARGFAVQLRGEQIAQVFAAEHNLRCKTSAGSTQPAAVQALLATHTRELAELHAAAQARATVNADAYRQVDDLLFSAKGI